MAKDNKIRIAIVGVGNCASSLIQGLYYYKDAKDDDRVPGLMHGAVSRKNVVSAVVIGSMLLSSNGCVVATGTAKPIESTINPAMTETYTPSTETAMGTPTAAAVTEIQVVTVTELPTDTATETQIPTETATATATEVVKIEEHELMPQYTLEVDQKYMGVQIKASLITDASLGFPEAKITLPESTYAQYITRVIYWAWWVNATSETHEGMSTEEDYKRFMELWATAQKTDTEADWKKVEFTTFGNDLNDGNGYAQEKMTFWPMHTGDAPEGVINFEKLSIAVVDGTKVENNDIVSSDYTSAMGTNLDSNILYVYVGQPMENGYYSLLSKNVASGLSSAPYWLGRRGKSTNEPPENKTIKNFLLNGGLQTGVTHE